MIRRPLMVIAAILVTALIQVAPAAAQEGPKEVIQRYYDVLYDVMRNAQALGFDGRYERIEPAIENTFNLPFIASFSVGRYWDSLGDSEREKLVDAVKRLSAATYAARFDDYSGEQFEVVDSKETERGDLLVLTNIIDSKGKPIGINYVMRQKDGEWKIVDVFLKGTYSELATRRAEFTSVIRRQGYDQLLAVIDQKVGSLREES